MIEFDVDLRAWRGVLTVARQFQLSVPFIFTKDGLDLTEMDAAHVALMSLTIPAAAFAQFTITPPTEAAVRYGQGQGGSLTPAGFNFALNTARHELNLQAGLFATTIDILCKRYGGVAALPDGALLRFAYDRRLKADEAAAIGEDLRSSDIDTRTDLAFVRIVTSTEVGPPAVVPVNSTAPAQQLGIPDIRYDHQVDLPSASFADLTVSLEKTSDTCKWAFDEAGITVSAEESAAPGDTIPRRIQGDWYAGRPASYHARLETGKAIDPVVVGDALLSDDTATYRRPPSRMLKPWPAFEAGDDDAAAPDVPPETVAQVTQSDLSGDTIRTDEDGDSVGTEDLDLGDSERELLATTSRLKRQRPASSHLGAPEITVRTSETPTVQAYNSRYLRMFSTAGVVSPKVSLKFSTDTPLCAEFMLARLQGARLRLYVAPKIMDD